MFSIHPPPFISVNALLVYFRRSWSWFCFYLHKFKKEFQNFLGVMNNILLIKEKFNKTPHYFCSEEIMIIFEMLLERTVTSSFPKYQIIGSANLQMMFDINVLSWKKSNSLKFHLYHKLLLCIEKPVSFYHEWIILLSLFFSPYKIKR